MRTSVLFFFFFCPSVYLFSAMDKNRYFLLFICQEFWHKISSDMNFMEIFFGALSILLSDSLIAQVYVFFCAYLFGQYFYSFGHFIWFHLIKMILFIHWRLTTPLSLLYEHPEFESVIKNLSLVGQYLNEIWSYHQCNIMSIVWILFSTFSFEKIYWI